MRVDAEGVGQATPEWRGDGGGSATNSANGDVTSCGTESVWRYYPPLAFVWRRYSLYLNDELVILGMGADPEPVDAACFVNA